MEKTEIKKEIEDLKKAIIYLEKTELIYYLALKDKVSKYGSSQDILDSVNNMIEQIEKMKEIFHKDIDKLKDRLTYENNLKE